MNSETYKIKTFLRFDSNAEAAANYKLLCGGVYGFQSHACGVQSWQSLFGGIQAECVSYVVLNGGLCFLTNNLRAFYV